MRNTKFLAKLSLLLILTLLVAAVAIGCGEEKITATDVAVTTAVAEAEAVGEGQYTFAFAAKFLDGSAKHYTVSTDCETVGEALLTLGLIDGENGAFGLYVKSVCGVVADYDIDQTYWALYVNGEMSMVGADAVKTAEATDVEFQVAK